MVDLSLLPLLVAVIFRPLCLLPVGQRSLEEGGVKMGSRQGSEQIACGGASTTAGTAAGRG